jgi:hypothetical protein
MYIGSITGVQLPRGIQPDQYDTIPEFVDLREDDRFAYDEDCWQQVMEAKLIEGITVSDDRLTIPKANGIYRNPILYHVSLSRSVV